jgi:large subunit ribosomal protein L9
MPKTYKLLLTESVESLGIVGDVVTVRSGYARNYLLPRSLATTPSEEKIAALAARRADAERHLAEVRKHREEMIEKLEGYEITLERTTNDQGLLYGSITQQDLATALKDAGFAVRPRDVRITQTIKRIGDYDVTIKPEADLEASIKLHVKSDRPLDLHKHEEPAHQAPAPAAGAPAEEKPKSRKSRPAADAAIEEKPKAKTEKPAKGESKAAGESKPKKAKKSE